MYFGSSAYNSKNKNSCSCRCGGTRCTYSDYGKGLFINKLPYSDSDQDLFINMTRYSDSDCDKRIFINKKPHSDSDEGLFIKNNSCGYKYNKTRHSYSDSANKSLQTHIEHVSLTGSVSKFTLKEVLIEGKEKATKYKYGLLCIKYNAKCRYNKQKFEFTIEIYKDKTVVILKKDGCMTPYILEICDPDIENHINLIDNSIAIYEDIQYPLSLIKVKFSDSKILSDEIVRNIRMLNEVDIDHIMNINFNKTWDLLAKLPITISHSGKKISLCIKCYGKLDSEDELISLLSNKSVYIKQLKSTLEQRLILSTYAFIIDNIVLSYEVKNQISLTFIIKGTCITIEDYFISIGYLRSQLNFSVQTNNFEGLATALNLDLSSCTDDQRVKKFTEHINSLKYEDFSHLLLS